MNVQGMSKVPGLHGLLFNIVNLALKMPMKLPRFSGVRKVLLLINNEILSFGSVMKAPLHGSKADSADWELLARRVQ